MSTQDEHPLATKRIKACYSQKGMNGADDTVKVEFLDGSVTEMTRNQIIDEHEAGQISAENDPSLRLALMFI